MGEKNTKELESILGSTRVKQIGTYLDENSDSLLKGEKNFSVYFKEIIKEKDMLQQDVFLQADIPERYGYKLISGEKHTKQRDIIIRLCYAAHMSLDETQKALRLYEMPQLYAKVPRDAVLIVCFNERPGSIIDINTLLRQQGMDTLRPSGTQE